MAKFGLIVLVPLTAGLALIGAAVGGRAGLLSALLGAGVMAANHLLAVASTGWARVLGPKVVAVSFAVFVVRMFAVFAAFAVLATLGWIHGTMLAASFCAALAVTLGAECFSYVRGSYVPAWRTIR